MHIDDETLQRFLHGELSTSARTATERHVAACAPCRERMEQGAREDDEVAHLLSLLDHPVPVVSADGVRERARRGRTRSPVRWAASVVLLLAAAGTAWAAPGSPLRAWWSSVRATPVAPPSDTLAPEAQAGLSVPADEIESVDVRGGSVRVRLVEGTDVRIEAAAADLARFISDGAQVRVEVLDGESEVHVQIPRRGATVAVQVGGMVRWRIRDGVIEGPAPDGEGTWVFAR